MMTKMRGYVLIAVLIFAQIFALLGLYALESGRIAIKASNEMLENTQSNLLIDQILKRIESSSVNNTPNCVISDVDLVEIKAKPLSWWQEVSCTGNFQSIQYYYIVELLGKDVCAQWHNAVAEYERITLRTVTEKQDVRLQQSTIIKPVIDSSTHCEQTARQIAIGRQSWRNVD